MATLSPNQFAILDAMGIPVWIENTQDGVDTVIQADSVEGEFLSFDSVQDEPGLQKREETAAVLPLLGNSSASRMLIGVDLSLAGNTMNSRLLLAMLSALGLRTNELVILAWDKSYQLLLANFLETASVTQIMLLGEPVTEDCLQQSINKLHHQKQLFLTVDTWVSYHPDELLKQPENKAAAWQDLQNWYHA